MRYDEPINRGFGDTTFTIIINSTTIATTVLENNSNNLKETQTRT